MVTLNDQRWLIPPHSSAPSPPFSLFSPFPFSAQFSHSKCSTNTRMTHEQRELVKSLEFAVQGKYQPFYCKCYEFRRTSKSSWIHKIGCSLRLKIIAYPLSNVIFKKKKSSPNSLDIPGVKGVKNQRTQSPSIWHISPASREREGRRSENTIILYLAHLINNEKDLSNYQILSNKPFIRDIYHIR